MSIIFFESNTARTKLLPLTYTRPIAEIRIGILTIAEKWSRLLNSAHYGYKTESYLQSKYTLPEKTDANTNWINSNVLPNPELVSAIQSLQAGEALFSGDLLIASRGGDGSKYDKKRTFNGEVSQVIYPWDIFLLNGMEIQNDFSLITKGRKSEPIGDPHTITYGNDIFLEKGASVKAAVLNSETGPIYIGKDAEVQEGAVIRGPFALCRESIVGMGGKVRGETTVGPYSKIGGEVSKSVLFGFSNKAHDGYLGNSIIGEWCNLGAGTSNSNLKNNYTPVKMWNYESRGFDETGLQFCGLIMGDHSKAGINTMFNTGSTVGVSANLFGEGFPRQIIPSFAWGGSRGLMTYRFDKAIETIRSVMSRRDIKLPEEDLKILKYIFDMTSEVRIWEKQSK